MAASNRARAAARPDANAGRSYATAPYDSMKMSRTSAPAMRDRSDVIGGLGASERGAAIAVATSRICRAYVSTTGVGNDESAPPRPLTRAATNTTTAAIATAASVRRQIGRAHV